MGIARFLAGVARHEKSAKQREEKRVTNREKPSAPLHSAFVLEPRILLDAAAALTLTLPLQESDGDGEQQGIDSGESPLIDDPSSSEAETAVDAVIDTLSSSATALREVLFIDAAIPASERVIQSIPSYMHVVWMRPEQSGLQTITDTLETYDGLTAIHIVSHGDVGELALGSDTLNSTTLDEESDVIAGWHEAFSGEGDILLYGCDVGSGHEGEQFINLLSTITGADVAASDDATGAESLGGDWDLEVVAGEVETPLFLSHQAAAAWNVLLTGSEVSESQKVTTNDIQSGDRFGDSTDVDGSWSIVGSTVENSGQGAAYIFQKSTINGAWWTQNAKLTANDGAASDYFGNAVAIDGDYAIVGAMLHDSGGDADVGAAYIFYYDGTDWTQQAKFMAPTPRQYDTFGVSVAIDGDIAVVGSLGERYSATNSNDMGAVYVFERSGVSWSQAARLAPSDADLSATSGMFFGGDVAIESTTIIVGAPGNASGTNGQGQAYIYEYDGSSWNQAALLTDDTLPYNSFFGGSVDIDESGYAVIGAANADTHGTYAGGVYVAERSSTTGAWSLDGEMLVSSTVSMEDHFGFHVRIDDGTIAVGVPFDDLTSSTENEGAVFLFRQDENSATWTQFSRLTASDNASNDTFGYGLALDDTTLIIGAPTHSTTGYEGGAAYLYEMHAERQLDSYSGNASSAEMAATTYLTSGEFVVAWDGDGQGSGAITASIYSVDDTSTDFTAINTGLFISIGGHTPQVAALSNGNFVVTYSRNDDIYATIFNASGVAQVLEFMVNTTSSGVQDTPDVVAFDSGGFAIVWYGDQTENGNLYGRFFSNDGTGGSEISLVSTLSYEDGAVIAPTSSGGFAMAWNVDSISETFDVYTAVFDASGTMLNTPSLAFSGLSESIAEDIVVLSDDSYMITGSTGATTTDVYARKFLSTGTGDGSEWKVNTTSGVHHASSVIQLTDGTVLVTWLEDDTDIGVARLYDTSGTALSGVFGLHDMLTGNPFAFRPVADDNGGYTAAWFVPMHTINRVYGRHYPAPTVVTTDSYDFTYQNSSSVPLGSLFEIDERAIAFDDHSLDSTVTLSIANATSHDNLVLDSEGDGLGQISYVDGIIAFGGEQVGSYSGGHAGSDLTLTLSDANPFIGKALERTLSFENHQIDPDLSNRIITVSYTSETGMTATGSITVRFTQNSSSGNSGSNDTESDPNTSGPGEEDGFYGGDGDGFGTGEGDGDDSGGLDGYDGGDGGDGDFGGGEFGGDPMASGGDGDDGGDGFNEDGSGGDGDDGDDGDDGFNEDGSGGGDEGGDPNIEVLTDENGDPVTDENGNPILVDADGTVIATDAEGEPLPEEGEGDDVAEADPQGPSGDSSQEPSDDETATDHASTGESGQAQGADSLQQQLLAGGGDAAVTKSDIDTFTNALMRVLSCGQ
ncbi:MAG: DUF4347 domain-containing protein [Magnetococcales bacterium]|nr:DUF4347 domain-containing protein [Magnetococcales bacterium]